MKERTKNMKFYYKKQTIFGMNLQLEQKVKRNKKFKKQNKFQNNKYFAKLNPNHKNFLIF